MKNSFIVKSKDMGKQKRERRLEELASVLKAILAPLFERMEEVPLRRGEAGRKNLPRFYRNEDLKRIFGLSSNTIVKYRQTGILPFKQLGDIYLYDIAEVEKSLKGGGKG